MEFSLIKFKKKLFLIIGILSTLGALMIKVGDSNLSIINFFIALLIMIQIASGKIYTYKHRMNLVLFLLLMAFSAFININNMPDTWSPLSIKGTLKFLTLVLPFCLFFSDGEFRAYRDDFFKGLKISAYIQLVWEIFQLILWNIAHVSLNEIIFGNIMGLKIRHHWTFISDGRFRPSGVSWEPANLSLSLVMGYCLSKNKYAKMLFVLGVLLSTSRTGVIMIGICIFLDLIKCFKEKFRYRGKFELKKSDILVCILIINIVLIIFLIFSDRVEIIYQTAVENISKTIQKLSLSHLTEDASANMHSLYYIKVPFILFNSTLFNILFGYGTFAAGLPYMQILNIYSWKIGWNPETDFITILMGNGVIGLVIYLTILYKCYKYNYKNYQYRQIITIIFFAGIFYLYIRSTWPFLILIFLFIDDRRVENKYRLN